MEHVCMLKSVSDENFSGCVRKISRKQRLLVKALSACLYTGARFWGRTGDKTAVHDRVAVGVWCVPAHSGWSDHIAHHWSEHFDKICSIDDCELQVHIITKVFFTPKLHLC
jgi:hypothetical protein